MTLEEKIKAMLAEEASVDEVVEGKDCDDKDMDDEDDEESNVETNPKMKKDEACGKMKKEETEEVSSDVNENKTSVSEQVSALLSAEGLSEDFRLQAVTIFEAAVSDRVLQIEKQLQEEFDNKLNEAKDELATNIDGYLSEAVLQWVSENKVEMVKSFKAELNESFIDGLRQLFVEHNIELPEESVNALEVSIAENEELSNEIAKREEMIAEMQIEINKMKQEKILESYKSKMTQTEFDRFNSLIESIVFESEEQYTKQLNIVKENFSVVKTPVSPSVVSESKETSKIVDPLVEQYATLFKKTI